MSSPLLVKCPVCQKLLEWSDVSPFRPFCSQRCKLIDLGDWATETHKIPGEALVFEEVHSFEQNFMNLN